MIDENDDLAQRVAIEAIALGSAGVFGALGLVSGGRGTHPWGVGAAGRLHLEPDPVLGLHPFFRPRTLRCVVRHAGFSDDDCVKQIRSASLKVYDGSRAVLDLPMNSGEENAFWDLASFFDFVKGSIGGPEGNRQLVERQPEMRRVVRRSLRRTPESYAAMHYHSKLVLLWTRLDGHEQWVRFRLVPSDGRDTGFAVGRDLERPWDQARLPGETRPLDYLRHEMRVRVLSAPVRFHLECQLHPVGTEDQASPARAWDLPWHALGVVELTTLLSDLGTEALAFRVDRLPEGLDVPRPRTLTDPVALTRIRTATYPVAQALRRVNLLLGRRPKRLGTIELRARLLHADRAGSPLHHVDVAVWTRGRSPDELARGQADADGAIRIEIPADLAHPHRFELRVLDPARPERVLFRLPVSPRTGRVLNLGALRIPWWEYDTDFPFARTRPNPQGKLPDRFGPGYLASALRQNLASRLRRDLHTLRGSRGPLRSRWSEVDRAWPIPSIWDAEGDGTSPASDRRLADQLLNGFYPCLPRVEDDGYVIRIEWTALESNGNWDLTDAEVRLDRDAIGLLPTRIRLRTRLADEVEAGAPDRPWRTFVPADPDWPGAKRALRAAWALAGEVDAHLGAAHLNVEQYALAAHRHLRRNPIARLLRPHLDEVAAINAVGDQAVFGPRGVLSTNAPLTGEAALIRFTEGLGQHDWVGWRPRRPLDDDHRFARAAQLFWRVTWAHVDAFVSEHASSIAWWWVELHRFSRDLVRHAVAFRPARDWDAVYDPSELPDPTAVRDTVDGVVRAISPLTHTDQPGPGELDRLKQLCAYVIFHASFFHTWENDLQAVDGGDPRRLAMGLRGGSFGPLDDPGIPPTPSEATNQLYFVHGLSSDTPGMLSDLREPDLVVALGERMRAYREEFRELGVDVDRIRSRINI